MNQQMSTTTPSGFDFSVDALDTLLEMDEMNPPQDVMEEISQDTNLTIVLNTPKTVNRTLLTTIEDFRNQIDAYKPSYALELQPDFINIAKLLADNPDHHIIIAGGSAAVDNRRIVEVVQSDDITNGYEKIVRLVSEFLGGQTYQEIFKMLMFFDENIFNEVKEYGDKVGDYPNALKLEKVNSLRKKVTYNFMQPNFKWHESDRKITHVRDKNGIKRVVRYEYEYLDFTEYIRKYKSSTSTTSG